MARKYTTSADSTNAKPAANSTNSGTTGLRYTISRITSTVAQGDDQQDALDPAEGDDQVRDHGGRPGHVHPHAAGGQRVVLLADHLDGPLQRTLAVGERRAEVLHGEIDQGQRRLAVLGRHHSDRPGGEVVTDLDRRVAGDRDLDRGDRLGEGLGGGQLSRRQRRVAVEQQERRERLRGGELLQQLARPEGLGVGRQERGGVVLLDLRQLARERTSDPADGEPDHEQDQGEDPAVPAHPAGPPRQVGVRVGGGTGLDGSVLDGTVLDGTVLDGSVLDGTVQGGTGIGAHEGEGTDPHRQPAPPGRTARTTPWHVR
ncbi:MAG: hypothetical protein U0Q19_04760 [Kineosporiaceae bacterium]